MAYIQEGLDKGYPLLEDPLHRRIFKVPTPLENILPIALKHITLTEWQEANQPRYYGDIQYKPAGDYVPPVEVLEVATPIEIY